MFFNREEEKRQQALLKPDLGSFTASSAPSPVDRRARERAPQIGQTTQPLSSRRRHSKNGAAEQTDSDALPSLPEARGAAAAAGAGVGAGAGAGAHHKSYREQDDDRRDQHHAASSMQHHFPGERMHPCHVVVTSCMYSTAFWLCR